STEGPRRDHCYYERARRLPILALRLNVYPINRSYYLRTAKIWCRSAQRLVPVGYFLVRRHSRLACVAGIAWSPLARHVSRSYLFGRGDVLVLATVVVLGNSCWNLGVVRHGSE